MKTKLFSESSAQTVVPDPDVRLPNFHLHQIYVEREAVRTHSESPVHSDDDDSLMILLQKRLNPSKKEDFADLQSELLQWRRREERKIRITCADEERKKARQRILAKESCLLRKIDALKNAAYQKVKASKVEKDMAMMAMPKMWESRHGTIVVEAPATRLARETNDVRKKVGGGESIPARIDSLQRVNAFLRTLHSNSIIKDILVLVTRELEILQRGTDLGNDMLEGMRTRLTNLIAKLVLKTNKMEGSKFVKPRLIIKKSEEKW